MTIAHEILSLPTICLKFLQAKLTWTNRHLAQSQITNFVQLIQLNPNGIYTCLELKGENR